MNILSYGLGELLASLGDSPAVFLDDVTIRVSKWSLGESGVEHIHHLEAAQLGHQLRLHIGLHT